MLIVPVQMQIKTNNTHFGMVIFDHFTRLHIFPILYYCCFYYWPLDGSSALPSSNDGRSDLSPENK